LRERFAQRAGIPAVDHPVTHCKRPFARWGRDRSLP
jgi:hypothetical protein